MNPGRRPAGDDLEALYVQREVGEMLAYVGQDFDPAAPAAANRERVQRRERELRRIAVTVLLHPRADLQRRSRAFSTLAALARLPPREG